MPGKPFLTLIGVTLRRCLIAMLTIMPMAAGSTPVVQATTLIVTNTNDAGSGSLRQRLTDANNGDTISFAPQVTGVITLTSGELDFSKSLNLTGPGAASLTISGNDASRVISITTGVSVTISGLAVANGNNYGSDRGGGGVYNGGALTLINSQVHDNFAAVCYYPCISTGDSGFGGGLYNNAGALTLINSQVYSNSTNDIFGFPGGGGLFNNGGTVTLTHSSVYSNGATGAGGGLNSAGGLVTVTNSQIYDNGADDGGGLYSAWGIVTLTDSQIYDNAAYGECAFMSQQSCTSGHGGGVYTLEGMLTLLNSQIYSNTAYGRCDVSGRCDGSDGGGVLNSFGTLAIVNSLVHDNQAAGCYGSYSCVGAVGGVGGGVSSDGTVAVSNSAVYSNTASSGRGGGLTVSSSTLISNTTISGNSATNGGGLDAEAGMVSLNNVTLADNTGGGISATVGANVTAGNSILADNTGSNCAGAPTSLGYNLASDASCGLTATGDLTDTDPRLGPLADNGPAAGSGSATLTQALMAGSPAIDAGNPTPTGGGGGACATTDQRGVPRPQGPRCDIGAFEVVVPQAAFSAALYLIAKDAGASALTVLLTPAPDLTATVSYATGSGTALAGTDYLTATGTLTFAPGVTAQAFTIPILNNPANTTNRTLTLTLSNPSGATLGSVNSATLLIVPKVFEQSFPFVSR